MDDIVYAPGVLRGVKGSGRAEQLQRQEDAMSLNRREFLKNASLGTAAMVAGQGLLKQSAVQAATPPAVSKVAFVSGATDRKQMILDVLEPLRTDIAAGIAGKKIIIKVNFTSTSVQLACTHVDAVKGVIEFLRTINSTVPIVVTEMLSGTGFSSALSSFGYNALTTSYTGITLVDGGTLGSTNESILELDGTTHFTIPVRSDHLDPGNYIISLCRPKSHDTVVATYTLKNVLMGSVFPSGSPTNRARMHGSTSGGPISTTPACRLLTQNLFTLANLYLPVQTPALGILDGYEGMQGNGPISGTVVNHRVAVASTDPIAADRIGVKLMGINPDWLKYLINCANAGLGNYDLSKITIVGPQTDVDSHIITYTLNSTIATQTAWFSSASRSPDFLEPRPWMALESPVVSPGGSVAIRFALPRDFAVLLDIYDMKGRQLRRLASENLKSGRYSIVWDGRDDAGSRVAAGNYIVKLMADSRMACEPVTVLR